jgi:hypothetical protein
MKSHIRANRAAIFAAAMVLTILTAGGHSSPVFAGEAGTHGGQVTKMKEFQFEVTFDRESTRVYLYDSKHNPVSAKNVTGTVNVGFRDKNRKPLDVKLSYAQMDAHGNSHAGSHQMGHGFLHADINLKEVQEGDMNAVFVLKNLPGESEEEVTFEETFELARVITYECPMSCVPPADVPGNCSKCGMTLKRTETIYACSMHPDVTSRNAGDKCWVCGMKVGKLNGETRETGGHEGHNH